MARTGKVVFLIARMAAGSRSIDDIDLPYAPVNPGSRAVTNGMTSPGPVTWPAKWPDAATTCVKDPKVTNR